MKTGNDFEAAFVKQNSANNRLRSQCAVFIARIRELEQAEHPDVSRLDWVVRNNASVMMCSEGGWDVFVVGDQGEPNVLHLAHGETFRAAIDAARSAGKEPGE